MSEKKERKKPSQAAIIRRLRERNSLLDERCEMFRSKWRKLLDVQNSIRKYYPEKYFHIFYKAKSNKEMMVNDSTIIESFTLEIAIQEIKEKLLHPDSFELIDIKVLY